MKKNLVTDQENEMEATLKSQDGIYKLNTDGAVHQGTNITSAGGLVKDSKGV